MTPQPWYTSKAFVVAAIGFLAVVGYGFKTGDWDIDRIAAALTLLLAAVFRWTADQPLALRGGQQLSRRALGGTKPSLGERLTKD